MIRKIIFSICFIGVAFSGLAQEWSIVKNAPTVTQRLDDIYFINDSIGWAVDGYGNIFKSTKIGDPWTLQYNTGRYNRSIEFINDSVGFAGSVDSAVFMTTNAGTTWERIDKKLPQGIPGVCGISHYGNSVLLVGTYYASPFVITSPDAGKTWVYKDMSSVANGLIDAWYKSADTVFISGKGLTGHGIVFRSGDRGVTWTEVSPTGGVVPQAYAWKLHFPTASVGYCALEEVTPADVPTSTKTRFLKTTDGGSTWTVKEAVIGKNIDLQGLGFVNANHGFIGGWSTGMYETLNGGDSWKLINSYANLNRFFFLRENFGYVSGTTVFKYSPMVITGTQKPAESKDVHSLDIYPNPAYKECNIKVTLGTHTMTVLTLNDQTGRQIRELSRGYQEEGEHNQVVDLKDLAAGEYMVILLTHEHFLAKKLIKKN